MRHGLRWKPTTRAKIMTKTLQREGVKEPWSFFFFGRKVLPLSYHSTRFFGLDGFGMTALLHLNSSESGSFFLGDMFRCIPNRRLWACSSSMMGHFVFTETVFCVTYFYTELLK